MDLDIFLIGLDQIGASIGIALATSELEVRCTGYDPDDKLARSAHQLGAVDQLVSRPVKACEIADVVILGTTSNDVRDHLELLGKRLKAGALVLDTSPFKAHHTAWASELLPEDRHYIGAMPIVGPKALLTEKNDLSTPQADLFQGGLLAMVVPPRIPEDAVALAFKLASVIGATPFFIEPLENDAVIATVQGLPYLMAAALMQMATKAHNWREVQRIAGRFFVNATHIDPSQSTRAQADALHLNRDVVINKLDEFTDELRRLRDLIASEDHQALDEYLDEAAKARDSWFTIRQSGNWAGQDLPPTERVERPSLLGGAFGLRSRRPKDHQ
jgi:prephenate dehydrogenase